MRQRRDGFTLIELLVAMALTLFIMAILAEAFKTGLEVFRQMKAIGDLESGLRNTTTLLRADLAADHFEGKKRLSNLDFYSDRPTQGFFRIVQSAASVSEGSDAEGLKSFRSTTHALHFTVKRRGNRREDFFAAVVPAGSPLLSTKVSYFDQSLDARVQDTANAFHSQWAEIGYYLVKTGTTIEPNNPNSAIGTPLFALYRVERLLVPNTTEINPPATLAVASSAASGYDKISYRVDPGFASMLAFNSPSDVTILANRAFVPPASPPISPLPGSTLVLTNVVSFHVQVLRYYRAVPNGAAETMDIDFGEFGFDSSTALSAGGSTVQPSFIRAVAATLRVWDQKTQQTRQVTVVQDM